VTVQFCDREQTNASGTHLCVSECHLWKQLSHKQIIKVRSISTATLRGNYHTTWSIAAA